ncbi:MAG TPA: hypothetical protein VI259_03310 [Gemmatimonadaceae bacterium]
MHAPSLSRGGSVRNGARRDPRQSSRRLEVAVDGKNIYFTLTVDDASICRLELNR